MGLRATFDVCWDLGYPEATEELGIVPDYDYGCDIFIETFLSVAKDLCPVDTGHLRSSITANGAGTEITCQTLCTYAQYVEYGTYKMSAQPYFEPALEEAFAAAAAEWDAAVEDAYEEEEQLLEEMEEQEEAASRGSGGISGLMGQGIGGFFAGLFVAAITGIFQGIMNVMTEIMTGGNRSRDGGSSFAGGFYNIDVEII